MNGKSKMMAALVKGLAVWIGCSLTLAGPSFAQEAASSSTGYVGADLGYALPTESSFSGRFTYGVNFGFVATENLTAGLYFLTSSETVTELGISVSAKLHNYGADLKYYLAGAGSGFFFGGKLGAATLSGEATATLLGRKITVGASETNLLVGPTLGYDHKLGANVSVGAQADALFVASSTSFFLVNGTAGVKYWF